MVLQAHKQFYRDIFAIENFFSRPFLMFGWQGIDAHYGAPDFKTYLERKGADVIALDYFDTRADLIHDMNKPIPKEHLFLYETVCDIGCLEHVYNTDQCLRNCLHMVSVGGLYVLHTPVAGYAEHGLYTFNAKMLRFIVQENGFDILYDKYSTKAGESIHMPQGDTLLWLVARKVKHVLPFRIPGQPPRNKILINIA